VFGWGLRAQLVIPLAIVLIAFGGYHTYSEVKSHEEEILREATRNTLRLADALRRSTRNDMLQSQRQDVHNMINEVGQQEDIDHVRILNKQGAIIYSSNPNEINQIVDRTAESCNQCHRAEEPLQKLETSERTRLFEAEAGHRTLAAIAVIANEPSCWTAACHVHPQDKSILGVLDVGVSLEKADNRVAQTKQKQILFGIFSTAAICALVGFFIDRSVVRPVNRLLDCTKSIAAGNLDCCIDSPRSDELGRLVDSFREMTVDLKEAQEGLKNWAANLEVEVAKKTHDLEVAQAQVIRSEKLSSLGLLSAGVAHELNSPLMGILTFAQLVRDKMPDDSSERDDLEVIITQTERCATIIRQLLDFSRENTPEKKIRDVNPLLDRCLHLVEHQALFHDIEIVKNLSSSPLHVLMDAGQMQQVFLNLLVNAGEAMPTGGTLTITTRSNGEKVEIVVCDTGTGIPPHDLTKIFDPFFTSKEVGKGTGLGLAVSYGIIEKHGGSIEVESTVGQGTTFTISLAACHVQAELT
jgi:two-component system NtrC family sensor kinase